jgi:hypothetical protein
MKILLEMEHLDKMFKFKEYEVFVSNKSGFTKQYEVSWANKGSSSWGRTVMLQKNGNRMPHNQAMAEFFRIVKASEKVNYVPIKKPQYVQQNLELKKSIK